MLQRIKRLRKELEWLQSRNQFKVCLRHHIYYSIQKYIHLDSLESHQHLALQSLKSWIQAGSAELVESPRDESDRRYLLETHVVEDLDDDLGRQLHQSYLSPHHLTVPLPGAVRPGVRSHGDCLSVSLVALVSILPSPLISCNRPFSIHSHPVSSQYLQYKKEGYELYWCYWCLLSLFHYSFYSQFDIISSLYT